MGYLALESAVEKESFARYLDGLNQRLNNYRNEKIDIPHSEAVVQLVTSKISELRKTLSDRNSIIPEMETFIDSELWSASEELHPAWNAIFAFISNERNRDEIFKQPKALHYVERLQEALLKTGIVGKSNALPDIVKTVHRELFSGKEDQFRIPDSSPGVSADAFDFSK